jgi:hypothetical protein
VEISEGVYSSQYQTIKRLMKFKNRDLAGTKIDDDLRYIYYFDIISPRVDSNIKNLNIDTKNIFAFSDNPREDFAAVFISNTALRDWMNENGEANELKSAIEEYVSNGNVGWKVVGDGYEELTRLILIFVIR